MIRLARTTENPRSRLNTLGRAVCEQPGFQAPAHVVDELLIALEVVRHGFARSERVQQQFDIVESFAWLNRTDDDGKFLYRRLRSGAGLFQPLFNLPMDRLLGAMARNLGHFSRAQRYYSAASQACARAGFELQQTLTDLDLARMLVERGASLETRAVEKRLESISGCTSVSGRREIARGVDEVKTLAKGRYSSDPGGLTPRETEVFELMSKGLTNAQIAGQLHITNNTVHYHVSNILLKTDAPNRSTAIASMITSSGYSSK